MARRSMAGQLNMFDFWDNLVQPEDDGQVQMVSLIPEEEPKTDDTGKTSETEGVEADFKQKEIVQEKQVQEEPVTQKAFLPEAETFETVAAGTTGMDLKPEETVQEKQVLEEPVTQKAVLQESAPVMQKQVLNPDGSIKAEVAFYNYNKVCVKRENEPEEWREFDNSKEAVEYYMEEMLKLQPENGFEDKGEDDE